MGRNVRGKQKKKIIEEGEEEGGWRVQLQGSRTPKLREQGWTPIKSHNPPWTTNGEHTLSMESIP